MSLPPWLISPSPSCLIAAHHGNAKQLIPIEVIRRNEASIGWKQFAEHRQQTSRSLVAMMIRERNVSSVSRARPPLRLLISSAQLPDATSLNGAMVTFGPLSPLSKLASLSNCRVVLFTQLYEPLAFYMRYYAQFKFDNSTGIPSLPRSTPRNLQSSFLFSPARVLGPGLVSGHAHAAAAKPVFLNEADTKQVAELQGLLRGLDLVGLAQRPDETLLMLADLIGLQHLLHRQPPPDSRTTEGERFTAAGCPEGDACAQLVLRMAPLDHRLFEEFSRVFEQRVERMGPSFQARLHAFRDANRAYQRATRAVTRADLSRRRSSPISEERFTTLPFRVPNEQDGGLRERVRNQTRDARFDMHQCADVLNGHLSLGKPWETFTSCSTEGISSANLNSLEGPCASNLWFRVNCQRTCGLCGFPLRFVLAMSSRLALRLTRRALRESGLNICDTPRSRLNAFQLAHYAPVCGGEPEDDTSD